MKTTRALVAAVRISRESGRRSGQRTTLNCRPSRVLAMATVGGLTVTSQGHARSWPAYGTHPRAVDALLSIPASGIEGRWPTTQCQWFGRRSRYAPRERRHTGRGAERANKPTNGREPSLRGARRAWRQLGGLAVARRDACPPNPRARNVSTASGRSPPASPTGWPIDTLDASQVAGHVAAWRGRRDGIDMKAHHNNL